MKLEPEDDTGMFEGHNIKKEVDIGPTILIKQVPDTKLTDLQNVITNLEPIEDLQDVITKLVPVEDLQDVITNLEPIEDLQNVITNLEPVKDMQDVITKLKPIEDFSVVSTKEKHHKCMEISVEIFNIPSVLKSAFAEDDIDVVSLGSATQLTLAPTSYKHIDIDYGTEEEVDVVSLSKTSQPLARTRVVRKRRRQVRPTTCQVRAPMRQVPPSTRQVDPSTPQMRPASSRRRPVRYQQEETPQEEPPREQPPYTELPYTDLETESKNDTTRVNHNQAERMRRINLKNLFNDLKILIPEIKYKKKASKIAILNKAITLCCTLKEDNIRLENLKNHETKLLKQLKNRWEKLSASVHKP